MGQHSFFPVAPNNLFPPCLHNRDRLVNKRSSTMCLSPYINSCTSTTILVCGPSHLQPSSNTGRSLATCGARSPGTSLPWKFCQRTISCSCESRVSAVSVLGSNFMTTRCHVVTRYLVSSVWDARYTTHQLATAGFLSGRRFIAYHIYTIIMLNACNI